MEKLKFIDMFAGIGGFHSGLEQAGMQCVGWIEIDKFARKSYLAIHNAHDLWTAEDITKVKGDELPHADLWSFGSPCQDLSIAGKIKGLDGERSGLFYEVMRLIDEREESGKGKPQWLLFANVKGALSSRGGQDFLEILYQVAERGYHIEWRVYNSKNYGVPQNRERVYLVGHLGEKPRYEILPKARNGGKGIKKLDGLGRTMQNYGVNEVDGISQTLTTNGGGIGQTTGLYGQDIPKNKHSEKVFQGYRVFETDGVSCTLSSAHGGLGVNTGLYGVDVPNENRKKKISQAYRVLETDGVSVTLASGGGGLGAKTGLYGIDVINREDCKHQWQQIHNPKGHVGALMATQWKAPPRVFKPVEVDETMYPNVCKLKNNRVITVRKLTPRECFRLQGFADEQFDRIPTEISDTQRYRQAGNSVTVPLVKEIGESIVKHWKGIKDE